MKQLVNWLYNSLIRVIQVVFPDSNLAQRKGNQDIDRSKENRSFSVGRLYYSIPGKCYSGFIINGRIVKPNA